jgi:dienelactone hydrolase
MIVSDVITLQTRDGVKIPAVLYHRQGDSPAIGVVLMHPVVDFQQHYAARPLAEAGFAVLCLMSRYSRYEHAVLMERVVLDLAEGVRLLRDRGCRRVALIGNSGGGPLMAFYQSQAERPTVTSTPDGREPDLTRADLPAADALIELNAHQGRHHFLTMHLDASVIDEQDLFSRDPTLDMFDTRNGPPYDRDWLAGYRVAQIARNDRITDWVLNALHELEARTAGQDFAQSDVEGQQLKVDAIDMPFVVHRTMADPRTVDLTIEPSDRAPGTVWGPAWPMNWSVTAMGRVTSLRSWLSQYSWRLSNASGPAHIARTNVPVLVVIGTADRGCYESDAQAYFAAANTSDKQIHLLKGGSHFMRDQADTVVHLVGLLQRWLNERFA